MLCRYQGLNTGVVLYHLGRMRASQQWASYLHKEDVFRLMDEYAFHVTLGDQDWFTNISFKVRPGTWHLALALRTWHWLLALGTWHWLLAPGTGYWHLALA